MIENEFIDTNPHSENLLSFERKTSWSKENQRITASVQNSFREATFESISDSALREQIRERRRASTMSRFESSEPVSPAEDGDEHTDTTEEPKEHVRAKTLTASILEWMYVNFFQEVNYLVQREREIV